ncbi:MAG: hypothetical protein EP319_12930 [Deltaproteobacteria bacterium]|nr:MAG: hypothetical protein EP319_12930 [Deltaproteobacteria bacterium]
MDVKEIIDKIKASLPFLNKGEEEDDDEVTGEHEVDIDDDDEEGAEPKKKKAKGEQGEEGDEEDAEVDEAAAKRSKLIKGVAGLVVAWVAIDEFILKEDPPPPAPVVQKRPQRKKPKKTPAPVETAVAETTPEVAPEVTPEEAPPEPMETPVAEFTPEETPETIETPVAEVTPDVTVEETPEPVATVAVEETPDIPVAGGETDTGTNPMGGFVDGGAGNQPMDSAITNLVDNVKDQNLEDKIAPPKMEYIEPPDYESLGRGLVYNCKGKHWACVDKRSYFKCRDNQKWSKENGKSPECVTRPVYASYEDCRTIQKYYVNTSFKVDFCE